MHTVAVEEWGSRRFPHQERGGTQAGHHFTPSSVQLAGLIRGGGVLLEEGKGGWMRILGQWAAQMGLTVPELSALLPPPPKSLVFGHF